MVEPLCVHVGEGIPPGTPAWLQSIPVPAGRIPVHGVWPKAVSGNARSVMRTKFLIFIVAPLIIRYAQMGGFRSIHVFSQILLQLCAGAAIHIKSAICTERRKSLIDR